MNGPDLLAEARARLADCEKERDALVERSVAVMHIAEEPRELWDTFDVTCPTIEAVKSLRNRCDALREALERLIKQCDETDWMGVAGAIDAALDNAREALNRKEGV